MNIQSLKAALQSKQVQDQIKQAMIDVFYQGHNVAHIKNRFGHAFLAFRLRDNKMSVRDVNGDITDLYLEASTGV